MKLHREDEDVGDLAALLAREQRVIAQEIEELSPRERGYADKLRRLLGDMRATQRLLERAEG